MEVTNQPKFKLTDILELTVQRLPIVSDIDVPLDIYTKSVYFNIISPNALQAFKTFADSIPWTDVAVFQAILGKDEYIDEILLPIFLNIPTLERTSVVHDQAKRLLEVVEKVASQQNNIVDRHSRYKQYFYSGNFVTYDIQKPRFELLPVFSGDEDLTQEIEHFREVVGQIRVMDYGPLIDLLEFTMEEFRTFLRFMPSDQKWVKLMLDRDEIFGLILSKLNQLEWKITKYRNDKIVFDRMLERLNDTPNESLFRIVKSQTKAENPLTSIQTTIKKLNAFATEYHASGKLSYDNVHLSTSISLLLNIFTTDYLQYLRAAKARYKFLLSKDLEEPPSKRLKTLADDIKKSKEVEPRSTIPPIGSGFTTPMETVVEFIPTKTTSTSNDLYGFAKSNIANYEYNQQRKYRLPPKKPEQLKDIYTSEKLEEIIVKSDEQTVDTSEDVINVKSYEETINRVEEKVIDDGLPTADIESSTEDTTSVFDIKPTEDIVSTDKTVETREDEIIEIIEQKVVLEQQIIEEVFTTEQMETPEKPAEEQMQTETIEIIEQKVVVEQEIIATEFTTEQMVTSEKTTEVITEESPSEVKEAMEALKLQSPEQTETPENTTEEPSVVKTKEEMEPLEMEKERQMQILRHVLITAQQMLLTYVAITMEEALTNIVNATSSVPDFDFYKLHRDDIIVALSAMVLLISDNTDYTTAEYKMLAYRYGANDPKQLIHSFVAIGKYCKYLQIDITNFNKSLEWWEKYKTYVYQTRYQQNLFESKMETYNFNKTANYDDMVKKRRQLDININPLVLAAKGLQKYQGLVDDLKTYVLQLKTFDVLIQDLADPDVIAKDLNIILHDQDKDDFKVLITNWSENLQKQRITIVENLPKLKKRLGISNVDTNEFFQIWDYTKTLVEPAEPKLEFMAPSGIEDLFVIESIEESTINFQYELEEIEADLRRDNMYGFFVFSLLHSDNVYTKLKPV